MEGFVLPTKRAAREIHFLPCVGDERARSIHFFSTGPRVILTPRLVWLAAEKFWNRREKESENRSSKDAALSPRIRLRRFDFMDALHAVFNLTLVLLLDHLLNFRDDIPGATALRGLTAWHLHHRAGSAPQERAPRPSKSRTGFSLSPFPNQPKPDRLKPVLLDAPPKHAQILQWKKRAGQY